MPGTITKSGSTSSAPATQQTEATSTTQSKPSKTEDGGAPPQTEQLQRHSKSFLQIANSKKLEMGIDSVLNGAVQFGKNAMNAFEKVKEKNAKIQFVQKEAKTSGLEQSEIDKLGSNLRGMDEKSMDAEVKFLRREVFRSPNADRALRTYNELKELQVGNQDRLQDKHIRILTRGVAEPRSNRHSFAKEGVLGQEGATRAAKALIEMPQKDYDAVNSALDDANHGKGERGLGSAQMERALILKAAGAREEAYTDPGLGDQLRLQTGRLTSSTKEILEFASEIRGEKRLTLSQQSTSIDPYSGDKALQQRWSHSCGATSAQGIKAEADPIYARKLHQEFIHNTDTTGDIAKEQSSLLEAFGGTAVERGSSGGSNMTNVPGVLNQFVSKTTGEAYQRFPQGQEGFATDTDRKNTIDTMAERLKAGEDMAIRVKWDGGGAHILYVTDVRGSGNNQEFLITDPGPGETVWMTKEQLASEGTTYPSGNAGKFSNVYW
ncbi:hypothetical protein L0156_29420 [bacterium]|nr:hypothetical protein [bacterium]